MEGNEAHVHHLLVYLCTGINDTHIDSGGVCDEEVGDEVNDCRGGSVIAAWAVGGEVGLTIVLPSIIMYDPLHSYSINMAGTATWIHFSSIVGVAINFMLKGCMGA